MRERQSPVHHLVRLRHRIDMLLHAVIHPGQHALTIVPVGVDQDVFTPLPDVARVYVNDSRWWQNASFALPLIANSKALVVRYEGRFYFPIAAYHGATEFGMQAIGEADYRDLKKQFATQGAGNWVLMPPVPFGPNEALLDDSGTPPNPPSWAHPMGTDDRGRDVPRHLRRGQLLHRAPGPRQSGPLP